MKNLFNKILCVILSLIIAVSAAGFCASAASADEKTSIELICANVAGLPIPALFSSERRVVPRAQRIFGKMLNESGADIVCVQEDFQYHSILSKQMTNYPYKTFTSGGIPAGDGLNIFSKYPIYNVERVAWEEFCGILTNDNDGLTPKGFLKCTVDFNGVLTDVYNIHTDASKTMEDQLAKKAQFIQLEEYIRQNSADMPVMITGDMNCTLHTYYYAEFYETMIVKGGFEDAWVNVVNGGNYLRGDDAQEIIDSYNQQYDNQFWGLWDSYERLVYKGTDNVSITPVEFSYKYYTNNGNKEALSDHAVMHTTVEIETSGYSRPDIALNVPCDKSFFEKTAYYFKMIGRCLGLIFEDLFRLIKEKI